MLTRASTRFSNAENLYDAVCGADLVIGAVLVNVNPAYRTHELEYVLKESRAKALLLIESFKSSNYLEMFYQVCPEARDATPGAIDSWRFPHLKSVICIGSEQLPGMLTTRSFAELGDDHDAEELRAVEDDLDFALDVGVDFQLADAREGVPGFTVFARGENLLDAEYEQVYGYRTPGRSVFGGLQVSFGKD